MSPFPSFFSKIGELDNELHCQNCRLPKERVVVDRKLSDLNDARVSNVVERASRELNLASGLFDDSSHCVDCHTLYCSNNCRDEALQFAGHRLLECESIQERQAVNIEHKHPLNVLRRLWSNDNDADAERALLSFRVLWRVLVDNYRRTRFSEPLQLGVPLRAMCCDEHVSRVIDDADGRLVARTPSAEQLHEATHEATLRDSSSSKGFVDERVTRAVRDTLRRVVASKALRANEAGIDLQQLTTLYARIASLVRLNGFRLAATSLRLDFPLSSDATVLPSDSEIDARAYDSVKFSGIFTIASYFNHSCSPNVLCVSTTAPSAHPAADLSARRGDQFAFVALAPIKADDEAFFAYTSPALHKSFDDRQAYLQKRYGFRCLCPLCTARK
jgi:hypothetical protein